MRRLLRELKRRGDKVVAHGLRELPSNRRLSADTEQQAVTILSQPVYRDFGPTLAAEYLAKKHGIEVSRETQTEVKEQPDFAKTRSRQIRPSRVSSAQTLLVKFVPHMHPVDHRA